MIGNEQYVFSNYSIEDMEQFLLTVPEYRDDQINPADMYIRLEERVVQDYQHFLGRDPSPTELKTELFNLYQNLTEEI